MMTRPGMRVYFLIMKINTFIFACHCLLQWGKALARQKKVIRTIRGENSKTVASSTSIRWLKGTTPNFFFLRGPTPHAQMCAHADIVHFAHGLAPMCQT